MVKLALPRPVAMAKTKKEAEALARKYIKPGHRKIRKTRTGYAIYVVD